MTDVNHCCRVLHLELRNRAEFSIAADDDHDVDVSFESMQTQNDTGMRCGNGRLGIINRTVGAGMKVDALK